MPSKYVDKCVRYVSLDNVCKARVFQLGKKNKYLDVNKLNQKAYCTARTYKYIIYLSYINVEICLHSSCCLGRFPCIVFYVYINNYNK